MQSEDDLNDCSKLFYFRNSNLPEKIPLTMQKPAHISVTKLAKIKM